jgi:hypothetical protein
MSAPTDVDRAAPVIAVHEIDIDAPLDMVWGLHTDVNAWHASGMQTVLDASLVARLGHLKTAAESSV